MKLIFNESTKKMLCFLFAKSNWFSIVYYAIKPNMFFVMMVKIYHRFFDVRTKINQEQYIKWLDSKGVTFEKWSNELSSELSEEALEFADKLYSRAKIDLANNPYDMGGGGLVHVLHFITRYYKPQIIVETGVASGFSSESFLQAMKVNSNGAHLYSSDFPYFRFPNSEKYIGKLVSDDMKDDWSLYLYGDEKNLPKIIESLSNRKINFFHYDSDKSYIGRKKAYSIVEKHLSPNAVVMFDDINDTPHFYDFVQNDSFNNYVVIRHKGACVAGIVFLGGSNN
jgi:predicted O-methyltransferase YrrM